MTLTNTLDILNIEKDYEINESLRDIADKIKAKAKEIKDFFKENKLQKLKDNIDKISNQLGNLKVSTEEKGYEIDEEFFSNLKKSLSESSNALKKFEEDLRNKNISKEALDNSAQNAKEKVKTSNNNLKILKKKYAKAMPVTLNEAVFAQNTLGTILFAIVMGIRFLINNGPLIQTSSTMVNGLVTMFAGAAALAGLLGVVVVGPHMSIDYLKRKSRTEKIARGPKEVKSADSNRVTTIPVSSRMTKLRLAGSPA